MAAAASLRAPLDQEHQYRSFEYNYQFKVRDKQITLKIQDKAGQVLHKQTFTLAALKMPHTAVNEETAPQILTILLQKKLLPAQYNPTPGPSEAQPDERETSLPPTPAVTPPSETTLDPQTLAALQQVSGQIRALLQAAELAEQRAIQTVIASPHAIERLIASQIQQDQALGEFLLIQRQEKLCKYYITVYQKLTGICLAALTIKSGMVENATQGKIGWASQILEAGASIPVVGIGLKIISGILKARNIQDNNRALNHLTHFFVELDTSQQYIKTLSRLLTLEQQEELHSLKSPQDKISQAINALKNWFNADEADNPLAVKAIEDSDSLIAAILTGKLSHDSSPERAAAHILGREVKPRTQIPTSPKAGASSRSSVDPASKEEVQRLETIIKALEARLSLHEARLPAKKPPKPHSLEVGGEERQLLLSDQDHPERAAQASAALLEIQRDLAALKARVDEGGIATATSQEELARISAQLQEVQRQNTEKKKRN